MKKSIPILFFICLIVPALVGVISLRIERAKIRREVKHLLMNQTPKDELCFLKFATNEIDQQVNWKHESEFEFNHKMYDIVSSEINGDSTYYWCWLDKEETALNKHFNELAFKAFNHSPFKNTTENNLNKVYNHLFIELITQHELTEYSENTTETIHRTTHYSRFSNPPPYPPPIL